MFHWLSHSNRRPRVRVTNVTGLDGRAQGLLRRVELSASLVVTATADNRPVITLSDARYGTEVLWESQDRYPTKYTAEAAAYDHLRGVLRSLLQAEVRT